MDGYFDAMDMRLIAGRPIDSRDRPNMPSVAVLNDTLAARLFPGLQPAQMIGQLVRVGWLNNITTEVVGVAASIRSRRVDAPPDPEIYLPFTQIPTPAVSYVVRSSGDPATLANSIRAALSGVVRDVPMAQVRTLDEIVSSSTRLSRLVSWLSVVFAILAAALAVLGVYSVLSYAVAQRMREFAIRAAVGASRGRLVASVLREGAFLSALGIGAGLAIAFQASGLLRRLLFGVSETDPVVFAVAAVGLAIVAAAGYLIPATRAAKADPIQALRE
jgi:ABC-type antimicrobial peptide transport system permease subunit